MSGFEGNSEDIAAFSLTMIFILHLNLAFKFNSIRMRKKVISSEDWLKKHLGKKNDRN